MSFEARIPLVFRFTKEARSQDSGITRAIGTKPAKANIPSRLSRENICINPKRSVTYSLIQEQASKHHLKWCSLHHFLSEIPKKEELMVGKVYIEIQHNADQVLYFLTMKIACQNVNWSRFRLVLPVDAHQIDYFTDICARCGLIYRL